MSNKVVKRLVNSAVREVEDKHKRESKPSRPVSIVVRCQEPPRFHPNPLMGAAMMCAYPQLPPQPVGYQCQMTPFGVQVVPVCARVPFPLTFW